VSRPSNVRGIPHYWDPVWTWTFHRKAMQIPHMQCYRGRARRPYALPSWLSRVGAVLFLQLALTGLSFPQSVRIAPVYQPLDKIVITGATFDGDRTKICVKFSGVDKCTNPDLVAQDHSSLTVTVPADAVSGPIMVQNAGSVLGTIEIQVMRPSGATTALRSLYGKITSSFLAYLVALASLGVLSMSIVQAIKNLLPVRQAFQRYRLRGWLKAHTKEALSNLGRAIPLEKVEKELVNIGAAGSSGAFYDAEIDDFIKQLAAVGRLAVNYPSNMGRYISYGDLLAVLASNVTKADLATIDGTDKTTSAQDRLDARNRIQQELNQGLNAFGLGNTWWWQNGLHLAAFGCSASITYFAVKLSSLDVQSPLALLGTALLAGFLAPVARDLVAAIENLRS